MKQIRTWEYQYEGIFFLPFLVNILGLGFTAAQPLMTKPHVHAKVTQTLLTFCGYCNKEQENDLIFYL